MPGTEVVRKQTVLGGMAGIAMIAFALIWRFYPFNHGAAPEQASKSPASVMEPAMRVARSPQKPSVAAPTSVAAPAAATTVAQQPKAPAPPPSKAIKALLARADKAMAAGDLVEPKKRSAMALYQRILDEDKGNAQARQGLEKIYKQLSTRADAALTRGDERESERLIGVLGRLPHDEEALHKLQTRLKTLRQVLPLLTRAADLLQKGHVTTPSGNNALAVYRRVLQLDPDNKLADQGLAQIQGRFLDRALAAAAQDNFAGADRILAQASPIRPGSQQLLDTRTRIEGIRREMASNILNQANSALDAGNPDLAEMLAKKALSLSPDLSGVDKFNERLRNARLYASFSPGQVITDKFRDRHGSAPALVVIPTGSFIMGSPDKQKGHRSSEEPQHTVLISTGFALGRDEVSVDEFRTFIDDSGYVTDAEHAGVSNVYDERTGRIINRRHVTWRDDYLGNRAPGFLPVVHVSWNDAEAYAQWLTARTGKQYRLPERGGVRVRLARGFDDALSVG